MGLEKASLLESGGKIDVDILKMPHHGSDRNMEPVFFQRITADHYVFSGDGEHGNPERETFRMLRQVRQDNDFLIHLTYPIDEIDVEREEDWKKEQAKRRARKAKVKPDWSREENSLGAFFDAHPEFGKQVRIVEKNTPYVIDLLEEIGF